MKTNLDYVIRSVTAPGETAPTLVPVIVNRIPSRSLSTVISNAIKNNLSISCVSKSESRGKKSY